MKLDLSSKTKEELLSLARQEQKPSMKKNPVFWFLLASIAVAAATIPLDIFWKLYLPMVAFAWILKTDYCSNKHRINAIVKLLESSTSKES